MTRRRPAAFTLIELIVAVVISAGLMIVLSLFLQRTISAARRSDDDAKLARRCLFALDRLRSLARHSISALHNFENPMPLPANRPIEQIETLFFVTDLDQDAAHREGHFVWFDRIDPVSNAQGTNKLLHAWKRFDAFPVGMWGQAMPPDMSSATFPALLAYLRTAANFNAGGTPTIAEGLEVLLDASADPASGARSVRIDRWSPPPWPDPPGAPRGIAFNVASVVTGAPPGWLYTPNPFLQLTNNLYQAYPKTPAAALGAHSCQVWFDLYNDRNGNGECEPEEGRFQLITSIQLLLVPSAGCAGPSCP